MSQVVYSLLENKDCEAVLGFWAQIEGVYLHRNGEDTPEGLALFRGRNPGCSFLAREAEKIVGAILSGHDGRRAFIYHLGVAESCRRRGIGTNLLHLAIEQHRMSGIKKSALFLLKSNISSETFYRCQDWIEEDSVKIYSKGL